MLQHVTREVPPSQLDPCIAFYTLLGFEPVRPPPGIGSRAVWLQRGPSQIHLMPVPDAVPQTGHVGLVIEDYERRVETLRAHGHEIEPRREHWGSARAFVRDPAGNLVEIMAFPPTDERGRRPPRE